jgi:transglutaminase-like putative cysteine protease
MRLFFCNERAAVWQWIVVVLWGIWGAGCSPADSPPPLSAPPSAVQPAEPLPSQDPGTSAFESWETIEREGEKAGYSFTRISPLDSAAGRRIESFTQLKVLRDGQVASTAVSIDAEENASGELVRFLQIMSLGSDPTRTQGSVQGGELVLETTSVEKTATLRVPWKPGTRMAGAEIRGLMEAPLKPGEQRSLSIFDPTFAQIVTVDLVAGATRTVPLPPGPAELLEIRVTAHYMLDDKQVDLESIVWTSADGRPMKSEVPAVGVVYYRTTREVAQAEFDPTRDLLSELVVPLKPALDNPHSLQRAVYRVTVADSDPSAAFESSSSQTVERLGDQEARVTVSALVRGRFDRESLPSSVPTDGEKNPGTMIQSDDPRVMAMAHEAVLDETDPWKMAEALERYVHDYIREKDYSQAMASAAEVAENRRGDCTEHAVLLCAMARAKGLPARVAIGLVAIHGGLAMGYHMWTEIHIDGVWIPFDAMLGQGGIGAGHILVAHSDLEGPQALGAFLPLIQLMRKLTIEVEWVDP